MAFVDRNKHFDDKIIWFQSSSTGNKSTFNYKLKSSIFLEKGSTLYVTVVNTCTRVVKVKMLITFLFDIYYRPAVVLLRICCLLFMS